MFVRVEEAAEAAAFPYLEVGDLLRVGDRLGSGRSGRVLAVP